MDTVAAAADNELDEAMGTLMAYRSVSIKVQVMTMIQSKDNCRNGCLGHSTHTSAKIFRSAFIITACSQSFRNEFMVTSRRLCI